MSSEAGCTSGGKAAKLGTAVSRTESRGQERWAPCLKRPPRKRGAGAAAVSSGLLLAFERAALPTLIKANRQLPASTILAASNAVGFVVRRFLQQPLFLVSEGCAGTGRGEQRCPGSRSPGLAAGGCQRGCWSRQTDLSPLTPVVYLHKHRALCQSFARDVCNLPCRRV